MVALRWLSLFTAVGILLASACPLLGEEASLVGNRLAEEIVGTWQTDVAETEWGRLRTKYMFGKNGVLVVTVIDESGQKSPQGANAYSFGAQYKISGNRLICEGLDREFEKPEIRVDGMALEIRGKSSIRRLTRKSKDESVVGFIDGLIVDLKASDRERRSRAPEGIRYVGPKARKAIPVLCEILADRSSPSRQSALEALINMGPDEKAIFPLVLEKLNDKSDPILAGIAADGLGKFGARAKEAVPALINMLKAEDGSNSFRAAEALGKIGPDARAAIPALSEWAKDKPETRRTVAAEAIKKIDPSSVQRPRPK